jgi:ubiquinone/menaquinone biosynthesis C-methylase UbiE/ADP-ribose pyrophosphatase YjhB (NUDIX family)
MPDLTSAALFERGELLLAVHRRAGHPPFAGQWLLPMTVVRDDEAAEDALRRHTIEQFGVALGVEQFVDTVYIEDPDDGGHRYVANIFRAPIEGAPMRFNAGGDYDDARWIGAADLESLWMPPPLRDALARILADPNAPPSHEWAAEAAPLGERTPRVVAGPPPDNRAGWDAIAAPYQDQVYGERFGERFMWSWALSEDDLHLLDDVRGKRVIVLGCGGGQDVVALDRMGAIAVGIDQSAKQIEYAKAYAARHDAPNASFVEGTVEDLSRFDDASFDMAVSAHMLNYVERIEETLRETHRVLKPGAAFVFSARHPFDATLSDDPPYAIQRSYWNPQIDWTWRFTGGESAPFRQWFWTVSRWFEMLTDAGFVVERILEPQEDAVDNEHGNRERLRFVPYTLCMKTRKR